MKFIEYSQGEIKYAVPDKAMYRDDVTQIYDPAKKGYKKMEDAGHHWICDGEFIMEMSPNEKQLVKSPLPAGMRGQALRAFGPLPFLFGAKKAEILQRYWVRTLPPPEGRKEFHLEAYPKFQSDAAAYQKVLVILGQEEYLPTSMVVYNVNFNHKNPAKTSYQFIERKENPINILNLAPWKKDFFEPKIPKDWKVVNIQPQGAATVARQPGPSQPAQQRFQPGQQTRQVPQSPSGSGPQRVSQRTQ